MPRKKTTESHSPESLRAVCGRFDALLAGPRRVADSMTDAGITVLPIDYQSSLEGAMKALNLWGHGCEAALTDELVRRGAFKAGPPALPEKRKGGRKPAE